MTYGEYSGGSMRFVNFLLLLFALFCLVQAARAATTLDRSAWTITCDSQDYGAASQALDGNTGTAWISGSGYPHWCVIDRGAASTGIAFSEVTWTPNQSNAYDTLANVYTSTDNSTWGSSLGSVTSTSGDYTTQRVVTFASPVSDRYLKIIFNTGSTYASVKEFNALLTVPLLSVTASGVTVTSADTFISCGSTCSHLYSGATSVTLTSDAAALWQGCSSITDNRTCVATVDATGGASVNAVTGQDNLVRSVGAVSTGADIVLAYPGGNNAGNLLVLALHHDWSVSLTITDTSNSWTRAVYSNHGKTVDIWYVCSAAAGANTVTIHPSGSVYAIDAQLYEFSGGVASSCLDKTGTNYADGGTSLTVTSASVTSDPELVFAAFTPNQGTVASASAGTGYIGLLNTLTNDHVVTFSEVKAGSVSGAQSASATANVAPTYWSAAIATFKLNPPGSGRKRVTVTQ